MGYERPPDRASRQILQLQCICTLVLTCEWAVHRACAHGSLAKEGTDPTSTVWTLRRRLQCDEHIHIMLITFTEMHSSILQDEP